MGNFYLGCNGVGERVLIERVHEAIQVPALGPDHFACHTIDNEGKYDGDP
jgi:hypothetical protein